MTTHYSTQGRPEPEATPDPTSDTAEERAAILIRITKVFWMERVVYVTITAISLLAMVGCALFLLNKDVETAVKVLGMVIPGAGCAGGVFGLLHMWNRTVDLTLGTRATGSRNGK